MEMHEYLRSYYDYIRSLLISAVRSAVKPNARRGLTSVEP